jgi:hypothetical protein
MISHTLFRPLVLYLLLVHLYRTEHEEKHDRRNKAGHDKKNKY